MELPHLNLIPNNLIFSSASQCNARMLCIYTYHIDQRKSFKAGHFKATVGNTNCYLQLADKLSPLMREADIAQDDGNG
jgi:hypothetical protein